MNRRNVLGNQVFESKTTWIVITGMLVTALDYVIYYVLGAGWLGILLSSVCILLGCAVVQLMTEELTELFAYLLIPCVFSGIMGLFALSSPIACLPKSGTLFLTAFLAWLLTVCYAVVAAWTTGNISSLNFPAFYKRATIFFYIVYIGLILYGLFFYDRIPLEETGRLQMVPFATLAAYIEAMINHVVPVWALVYYLLYRAVFFVPYGFLIALICAKLPAAIRILLLTVLPLAIELIQFVFRFNRCDIDDLIFAFIGGLTGMLCFLLFNSLFLHFTGKNYNGKDADREYYGRKVRL
ncbi:MAG: VanZ family protein [Lachnospiraceae bacterium]